MERHATDNMPKGNVIARSLMERSSATKWAFKVIGVLGVGLLLAGV